MIPTKEATDMKLFWLFRNDLSTFCTHKSVRIDFCSVCQLKCPTCPTGKGLNENSPIGKGYLSFENFKKFIDENPSIKTIKVSNWGEILLNPDLIDILQYAYKRNVELSAIGGVNMNNAKDIVLEALVKYKVKIITVAIDGASNDTYRTYRKGGNFNNVIANVKKLNEFKKIYNSDLPKLRWQFVIFGHNEHEIITARKMANELNMEFVTKLNWDDSFSPVKNAELVKRVTHLNAASRKEYKQKNNSEYAQYCWQLWHDPQINWDGKLLGCCENEWSHFGNVFENGLTNCLKSEKYIYAKKMLLGKAEPRDDIACTKCPIYIRHVRETPLSKKFILARKP
jgi:MoaA/NifB/PqqE/SkfB family radical SAM enzyme